MKRPTKAQMTKTLNAVRDQCGAWCIDGDGPKLLDIDGYPAIVWEEGPYEWPFLFPYGGIEEEFGTRRADVSDRIPAGWYAEALTHYSITLYEA